MILKTIGVISLFLVTFIGGFVVGRMNIPTPFNAVVDSVTPSITTEKTNEVQSESSATKDTPSSAAHIDIAAKLTDSQRKMLESFGLDPDSIVITPAVIACAEAKLGKTRMDEITNGATPSLLEGASLVACYK